MSKEQEAFERINKDYLNYLENSGYIIDKELDDLNIIKQSIEQKSKIELECNIISEKLIAQSLKIEELEKRNEPMSPVPDTNFFHCGNCKKMLINYQNFCHNCGKEVNWNNYKKLDIFKVKYDPYKEEDKIFSKKLTKKEKDFINSIKI